MADPNERFSDNIPGPWYVDSNCIICGLCEELAPAIFKLSPDGDHNFVHHQPETPEDLQAVEAAREHCPVEAIGNDG